MLDIAFKKEVLVDTVRKNASLFDMSDAGQDVQKFVDCLDEFFEPSINEIVAFHVNKKKGTLTFVERDRTTPTQFRVVRMFPMGNKWVGSVDAEGDTVKVIKKLLELQERFI